MKKRICGCLTLVMMVALDAGGQETVTDKKPVPVVTSDQPMSFWMEKKLEYSKKS